MAKLTLYTATIAKLYDAAYNALDDTASLLLDDITTRGYVPKDTGMLEASGHVSTLEGRRIAKITYNTPYARRLYFHPEYNFRKSPNRNARGRWMDSYTDKNSEDFNWLKSTFAKKFEEKLKEEGIL